MFEICFYFNQIQMDNEICNGCLEFMNTCYPLIDNPDGFSSIAECSSYFCHGCAKDNCIYKSFINL